MTSARAQSDEPPTAAAAVRVRPARTAAAAAEPGMLWSAIAVASLT